MRISNLSSPKRERPERRAAQTHLRINCVNSPQTSTLALADCPTSRAQPLKIRETILQSIIRKLRQNYFLDRINKPRTSCLCSTSTRDLLQSRKIRPTAPIQLLTTLGPSFISESSLLHNYQFFLTLTSNYSSPMCTNPSTRCLTRRSPTTLCQVRTT